MPRFEVYIAFGLTPTFEPVSSYSKARLLECLHKCVYSRCMSRVRTNIEIEDDYLQAIMDRYRLRTKTEAVDLALRHLAGQQHQGPERCTDDDVRTYRRLHQIYPPREYDISLRKDMRSGSVGSKPPNIPSSAPASTSNDDT